MTALVDRSEPAGDVERLQDRNRWQVIAIGVLGAAVLVLGFMLWIGTRSSVPSDVWQVVDEYNSAIIEQDAEAWRALVTDDWYYSSKYYGPDGFLDDMSYDPPLNVYATMVEFEPFEYEQVSDPIFIGEGPWFVTMHQLWSDVPRPNARVKDYEGTMTYVVIEQEGEMKVAAGYWTGTAEFADKR